MNREKRDDTSAEAPHPRPHLASAAPDLFPATDRSYPTEIPRPHVEFPATIQLDAQSRRHTRVAPEFPVELAIDTPIDTPVRHPLSEFAPRTIDSAFRPLLEVDGFVWPDICKQILDTTGDSLNPLAKQILLAAEAGRSVVAMTADQSGTGCTTILLCLAQRLATLGARVALVDASFDNPALGDRLGLMVEHGWDHVLRGQISLAEAVIASHADRMVLLPLVSPIDPEKESDAICSIQAAVGIGVLREHYDVTLMDVGAMDSSAGGQPAVNSPSSDTLVRARSVGEMSRTVRFAVQTNIDRILAIYKRTDSARRLVPFIEDQFIEAGIPPLGVIENFVAT